MKTCALTGHRALPPDFDRAKLYDDLEELIQSGCDEFLCGMAMGFDLLALECLIALRQKYRILLRACVPFEGQERSFPPAEKARYREMIAWCDEVYILYPAFRDGCFLARDRFMVEHADMLYAYCTRDTGGSAYTVKYAKSHGLEIRFF